MITQEPYYRLPPNLAADIDTYQQEVSRFLVGELPAAVLKAKRVPRGVYEQRVNGTYMVRVRVAGGALGAAQARALAGLSREFGNGLLHVTTRQDLQIHDVPIEQTPVVMRRLAEAALTSKGGGGNTVRNITACPHAGICPGECFDVTPCVHAVTETLIAGVGSYNLPRKYKIAFSGCAADCALAQVADLGFVAAVRDGRPGFRVLAGGGMGAQSRLGDTLLEWVPATACIQVAETVRRLFDRFGDRENRQRARLRFVFERMGAEAFRRDFETALVETIRDGVPAWTGALEVREAGEAQPPRTCLREGVGVIRQRQAGYLAVPLHAPLGFLPAGDVARIGELAAQFSGEAGVRATLAQNLVLRFVREADLPELLAALRGLETDVLSAGALSRFVACAGASTCRLGICLARHAARAGAEALETCGVSRGTLDALSFFLNGCPNACGQQPIAPIGFMGVALRAHGRLVPAYAVTLGGRCDGGGARFGQPAGKVPAAAVPAFLCSLARDFESARAADESFVAFFDRQGITRFKELVARHAAIPAPDAAPEYYHDVGADEPFTLAGRGAGECGAGVFEVIREDLDAARRATAPFDRLLAAARALLITRGVDARQPDAVFREFDRHFIETGLADTAFRPLFDRARGYMQGWPAALEGQEGAILNLLERVERLYATLDANLVFHPPADAASATAAPLPAAAPAAAAGAGAAIDLRGVACPMNFVKAKLKLETLRAGEALEIVLDEGAPVENVPASFTSEGQQIEAVVDLGNGHWRVTVRKCN